MISTLLVLSALIIGFISAIMFGIQRSDLIDGDMLWINFYNMTSKPWILTIDANGIWHTTMDPFAFSFTDGGFASHVIGNRSIQAVARLVGVIFALTGAYFSLHISDGRSDPDRMQRWMIFGCILIAGSLSMFFYAFFDATMVIGNAIGTLYPPIRQHSSYDALLESVRTGGHIKSVNQNCILEPKAQNDLQYYAILGLAAGTAGGALAVIAANFSGPTENEKDIIKYLKALDLNSRKPSPHGEPSKGVSPRLKFDYHRWAHIFSGVQNLEVEQLKLLTAEHLMWIGMPYGDAFRLVEAQKCLDADAAKDNAAKTAGTAVVQSLHESTSQVYNFHVGPDDGVIGAT